MIFCVWYPTGGFGHFINGILHTFGGNFVRNDDQEFVFSPSGDSHQNKLIAPRYFHDQDHYTFDFDSKFNYGVLIDNGIHNQGTRFKTVFPHAKTIKVCYLDSSWPIVARTIIHKVLQTTLEEELAPDPGKWPSDQDWAQREKYFLYLRDHWLRPYWKPDLVPVPDQINLLIEDLLDYRKLFDKLTNAGIVLADFRLIWDRWRLNNDIYITPVETAQNIIQDIKNNVDKKLNHVTDLWTQAVTYYYIWIEFGREVPHNDFPNFFASTAEINRWLQS